MVSASGAAGEEGGALGCGDECASFWSGKGGIEGCAGGAPVKKFEIKKVGIMQA